MTTTRLRIQHASFQRTDPRAQQAADVAAMFAIGGDFIGLTEIGYRENPTVQPFLRAAAAEHGYRLFLPAGYGEGIAVRKALGPLLRKGVTKPFVTGHAGEYPDRAARFVTVKAHGIGVVSYVVFHANPKDVAHARHASNVIINTGVGQLVRRLGRGSRIVFASADTNVDDATDNRPTASTAPLRAAGLVSCWDEIEKWPHTAGSRTIDVIYRYARDGRVALGQAHALKARHSDHRPVFAAYDVEALR